MLPHFPWGSNSVNLGLGTLFKPFGNSMFEPRVRKIYVRTLFRNLGFERRVPNPDFEPKFQEFELRLQPQVPMSCSGPSPGLLPKFEPLVREHCKNLCLLRGPEFEMPITVLDIATATPMPYLPWPARQWMRRIHWLLGSAAVLDFHLFGQVQPAGMTSALRLVDLTCFSSPHTSIVESVAVQIVRDAILP